MELLKFTFESKSHFCGMLCFACFAFASLYIVCQLILKCTYIVFIRRDPSPDKDDD